MSERRSRKPLVLLATTVAASGVAAALLRFVELRRCGDEVQGLVIPALAVVLVPALITLFWGRRRWWWGIPSTVVSAVLLLALFEPFGWYDCYFSRSG